MWPGELSCGGRRVAYFQIGDMTEKQVMGRILRRAAYRPVKAKTVMIPQSIMLPEGQRELAVVELADKTYEKPISWPIARLKAFQKAREKYKGDFRLLCHPVMTISVQGIKAELDQLDEEGYKSDVVVVDYAANLAPVNFKLASHEQTAYTWAMLRQISEMRNCLVVTANQTNKEGFTPWVLTRKHFADSKMILAHVTAFLGINKTDEEVENRIIRYNFIVRRESFFSETYYCLYMGSYLDVCNPCVVSCLPEVRR